MSDPFSSPARPVSRYVLACASATVLMILLQFLMAGLALFQDGSLWTCHVHAGFLLIVPIGVMLFGSLRDGLPTLTRYAGGLLATYVLQVVLVVASKQGASPLWQALHPFNGALMLVGAVALLMELRLPDLRRRQAGL